MTIGIENYLETRKKIIETHKKLDPHGRYDNRMKGYTLRSALHYIYLCMYEPDVPRLVHDHGGTRTADRHQLEMIIDIVRALGLECFYFRATPKVQMVYSLKKEKFTKWAR